MSDSNHSYTVNLFVPCYMDQYFSDGVAPMISVLKRLGETVYYNSEMTCCGRQFFMRGEVDVAKKLADQMVRYFDNVLPVVCPSNACISFIQKHYKSLTESSAVFASVSHIVQNSYEICDYIVNKKGITNLGNKFESKVFYFQSCAARNMYRAGDEAITLLQNTEGVTLFTDPSLKLCCSANGSVAMHNGELSEFLLKSIVDRIKTFEVDSVTSTDLHCLQYLDAYIQTRKDVNFEIVPITEILNAGFDDE